MIDAVTAADSFSRTISDAVADGADTSPGSGSSLANATGERLRELHDEFSRAYEALAARGLALDLARGKPSPEQLDLSNELLSLPGASDFRDDSGADLRNYGGVAGLAALRAMFSNVLRVPVPQLLALGNASLNLMYDVVSHAMVHGVPGGSRPWVKEEAVSFLCPVPGYDRHFAITQQFGVRMIPVPLTDEGPDLETVERLLAEDPTIKGMWCVPVYSNPTGTIYSERVARALVSLPAAADFRLFWDNAYAVHHLTDEIPAPIDILSLAEEAGHPDRPFVFASTSKITFPGSGVAFFGSSPANVSWLLGLMAVQTIGPDKLNQLRHVRFLRDADGVAALMMRHRAIIAPKFAAVAEILGSRLAPFGSGSWTDPTGGYFVTLTVRPGCAKRVIELAARAGIVITPAGSTSPYGVDPDDAVIRIAPTFPSLEELRAAVDGLCTCVLLAEAKALLA
jgi:DNA-binding transcriptional MocR family regulator